MYSFGSTRVGDTAYARAYNSLVSKSFRVIAADDPVITIPALLGYKHVKHCIRLLPDLGELMYEPESEPETADERNRHESYGEATVNEIA
jgi:hypothetical protein